jgi:hypothetical protein
MLGGGSRQFAWTGESISTALEQNAASVMLDLSWLNRAFIICVSPSVHE